MKTDFFGSVDPYIEVECRGAKVATSHITNNTNPIWQTRLVLPIVLPAILDKLIIRLFDRNGIGSN